MRSISVETPLICARFFLKYDARVRSPSSSFSIPAWNTEEGRVPELVREILLFGSGGVCGGVSTWKSKGLLPAGMLRTKFLVTCRGETRNTLSKFRDSFTDGINSERHDIVESLRRALLLSAARSAVSFSLRTQLQLLAYRPSRLQTSPGQLRPPTLPHLHRAVRYS